MTWINNIFEKLKPKFKAIAALLLLLIFSFVSAFAIADLITIPRPDNPFETYCYSCSDVELNRDYEYIHNIQILDVESYRKRHPEGDQNGENYYGCYVLCKYWFDGHMYVIEEYISNYYEPDGCFIGYDYFKEDVQPRPGRIMSGYINRLDPECIHLARVSEAGSSAERAQVASVLFIFIFTTMGVVVKRLMKKGYKSVFRMFGTIVVELIIFKICFSIMASVVIMLISPQFHCYFKTRYEHDNSYHVSSSDFVPVHGVEVMGVSGVTIHYKYRIGMHEYYGSETAECYPSEFDCGDIIHTGAVVMCYACKHDPTVIYVADIDWSGDVVTKTVFTWIFSISAFILLNIILRTLHRRAIRKKNQTIEKVDELNDE